MMAPFFLVLLSSDYSLLHAQLKVVKLQGDYLNKITD